MLNLTCNILQVSIETFSKLINKCTHNDNYTAVVKLEGHQSGGAPCPRSDNGKCTLSFWTQKDAPCPLYIENCIIFDISEKDLFLIIV